MRPRPAARARSGPFKQRVHTCTTQSDAEGGGNLAGDMRSRLNRRHQGSG